jgi:hypothetical protein
MQDAYFALTKSIIVLKKDSSESQLRSYFERICQLIDKAENEFPINLDEVWSLTYNRKSDAVEALSRDFIQDVDYKVLRQNPQNPLGGRPMNEYNLSIPCFEFFIARKVRPVFEVYRQVFHAARKGELRPKPLTPAQQLLANAQMLVEMEERQKEQERQQKLLESRQSATENRVNEIETRIRDNGFMAVVGFANINHLKIGDKTLQKLGRQCSAWCRRMGITPEQTRHEKWGHVNTYPMQALKDVFKANYPDKAAMFDTSTYWG